jgi:hypothetical protein
MATGSLFLVLSTTASASTTNGTATITSPTGSALTYPAASTTQYMIAPSTGATCTGNTVSNGTEVYTYLVKQGTSISGLTVADNIISTGYALFDYTPALIDNVDVPSNNLVPTLPNDLEWGPGVTSYKILSDLLYTGGTIGVWEAGIACVTSAGLLTDNWNTEITFTASSSDPNGFVWSAVPGLPGSTGTSGSSSPTTTAASGSTTAATTASGSTTATTAATGSTTTTAAANGTSDGSTSGSSGSSGSGDSGTGTGTLPFTGMPASVTKIVGAGLLGIGFGMVLLGWGGRRRLRTFQAPRGVHR